MKIVFVIVSMSGGGAERVISILANQFVNRGIDVTIMMTAGEEVAYQLDPRIHLVCAGHTSGGSMKKRLQRVGNMRRYFKANRDSIIISFGPGTSFFAVLADIFLRNKFIISERNDPAICPYPRLRNIIYDRAERLVFQTEDAKNCFPKRMQKKGCVIPNPVSYNLPEPYGGERDHRIVAVGRLEEQKNYPLLLRAFRIFHENHKDYSLHIYGKGSLEPRLQEMISEMGLKEMVTLEGFCSDVISEIRTAGMYVLPSDYEGVSNALIEALAMGLPVVATDCPIGGCKLCITNKVNGMLVPVGDEKSMAEAMGYIADDTEMAKEMGKQATCIRDDFSEKKIADYWLAEAEKCLFSSGKNFKIEQ